MTSPSGAYDQAENAATAAAATTRPSVDPVVLALESVGVGSPADVVLDVCRLMLVEVDEGIVNGSAVASPPTRVTVAAGPVTSPVPCGPEAV